MLTWLWIDRRGASRTSYDECSRSSQRLMAILAPYFTLVDPKPLWSGAWPALTDADDHHVWAAARLAAVSVVVSNNIHDFPPQDAEGRHRCQGIQYLLPEDFFRQIGYEPAD